MTLQLPAWRKWTASALLGLDVAPMTVWLLVVITLTLALEKGHPVYFLTSRGWQGARVVVAKSLPLSLPWLLWTVLSPEKKVGALCLSG